MNKREKRFTDVLFVGGPIDGRVLRVEANRVRFDFAIIPERLDANGDPVAHQTPWPLSVRYIVRTLDGCLTRWRIGYIAGQEKGFDKALCQILNGYSNGKFCDDGELVEGETQEIEK